MNDLKTNPETIQFRASEGKAQGFGSTSHDALEALVQNPKDGIAKPIVIWPYNQGDQYFTEAQQRLQELKARRDTLTSSEQQELEQLVEASFDATIARTQSLRRLRNGFIPSKPNYNRIGVFFAMLATFTLLLVLPALTGCGGSKGTDVFTPEYRTDNGVIVYYEPSTSDSTRQSIAAKFDLKVNVLPGPGNPNVIFYCVRPNIDLDTLSEAIGNEAGVTRAGIWGTGSGA